MQRRRLLLGAAGLAGSTILPRHTQSVQPTLHVTEALNRLERVCLDSPAPPDLSTVSLGSVSRSLEAARQTFASGDYAGAISQLAHVLNVAQALAPGHVDGRAAYALLAEAYALTTETLMKVDGMGIAPITADRGVAAARASQSPATLASAVRPFAIVLRHTGHSAAAIRLVTEAADRLRAYGLQRHGVMALYIRSLCTSAYTAAHAGDRSLALDLINEAGERAHHLGASPIGAPTVSLYDIGVRNALGEPGAAIAATTRLRPAQLPTAERRARYWCDTARAWHQYGDPSRTYQALVAAYREAPGEVRDRPSMRILVSSLLRHEGRLPGLRSFAVRTKAVGSM